MQDQQINPYDKILYPSYIHEQTHPDRLATLGALHGMKPSSISNCRVLELGCGSGTNIISMAFFLPESEFVGIDSASQPIINGRARAKAIGLKNLTLHQLNLLDDIHHLGDFDYIIAHGLYSWVPSDVRDRILAICQNHLRPQGVAYVSYNAYPGCYLRQITREMMLIHTKDLTNPQESINQSLSLIKWLAEAQTRSNAYSKLIKEKHAHLSKRIESSIYHDELSEVNQPVYFYQFVYHAAKYGLQFLSEADYFEMYPHNFPQETIQKLQEMAVKDIHVKEQYLDFLQGRSFRQTLLCRRDMKLNRTPMIEDLKNLYIASPALAKSPEPDVKSKSAEDFVAPTGSMVSTDHPVAKAALYYLSTIWPLSASFGELLTATSALLSSDKDERDIAQDESALYEFILRTYSMGLTRLSSIPSICVAEAGERPLASPLARMQITSDSPVTNLFHQQVMIEGDLAKELLVLLDGTRDHAALLKELTDVIESGKVFPDNEDVERKEIDKLLEKLPAAIEENLDMLAKLSLLMA